MTHTPVLDRYGIPIEVGATVHYVHGTVVDVTDLENLPEGCVTAVYRNPDVVACAWRGTAPPHFSGHPQTLIVSA